MGILMNIATNKCNTGLKQNVQQYAKLYVIGVAVQTSDD